MKNNVHTILDVPGFLAGAVAAGIKYKGRKDLAVIFSQVPACAAGVFTTNRVKAAPVLLDQERIGLACAQAIVVNSGNANACTGARGMEDAHAMARAAAGALGIEESLVLVASTGVIGLPMDVSTIERALPTLAAHLSVSGLSNVAEAIMTTDTFPKIVSRRVVMGDRSFTVTAVAKGAGMIRPDMATMLCFVCTDVGAEPGSLQAVLEEAVAQSFNAITVDGDTSTNDTVLVLANGVSGLDMRDPDCGRAFKKTLNEVLTDLAHQIVEDGEGATKFVAITVEGASTEAAAKKVAYSVAESPLVKTAFFGEDANWGRIIAAVGRAGVAIAPEKIQIFFDKVRLVKDGQGCGKELEAAATHVLKSRRFSVTIDLGLGTARTTVYTCDLTADYIRINAHYRT
jgi:glutamate N-acetyltransferase/amino-acid N-acetyltransferase